MLVSTLMPTLAYMGRRSWDSCPVFENYPVLSVIAMIAVIGIVILYYTFMVKAIKNMLTLKVNTILLIFAFIALIPFPFTFVLGIMVLIIWHQHKKALSL